MTSSPLGEYSPSVRRIVPAYHEGVTTPLPTGVGRVVVTDTDTEPRTGEPDSAHIVKSSDADASAGAQITEARVFGTPVEALCGAVFVPQRDPSKLPLCGACKDIYDTYRVFSDGLPENPDA
jgi:hypothetical protein